MAQNSCSGTAKWGEKAMDTLKRQPSDAQNLWDPSGLPRMHSSADWTWLRGNLPESGLLVKDSLVLLARMTSAYHSIGPLVNACACYPHRKPWCQQVPNLWNKPGQESCSPPWISPTCQRSFCIPAGYLTRSCPRAHTGWNVPPLDQR
jgi:hypothetical protein